MRWMFACGGGGFISNSTWPRYVLIPVNCVTPRLQDPKTRPIRLVFVSEYNIRGPIMRNAIPSPEQECHWAPFWISPLNTSDIERIKRGLDVMRCGCFLGRYRVLDEDMWKNTQWRYYWGTYVDSLKKFCPLCDTSQTGGIFLEVEYDPHKSPPRGNTRYNRCDMKQSQCFPTWALNKGLPVMSFFW